MSIDWNAWGRTIDEWYGDRKHISWQELAGNRPDSVAVCVVDMLEGFARIGALASPRVVALADPVRRLVDGAHTAGGRIVACQDSHSETSVEFGAFPPHCLADSPESRPMKEMAASAAYVAALPVAKNNLCALFAGDWHRDLYEDGVRTFVVCGDCTDLCINYLAMPLRLWANEHNLPVRVVVPADAVDTFDIDGHPGDPVHRAFLYHMAGNGVEVVRSITFG